MKLGKLGTFVGMDSLAAADPAALAQRIEKWGHSAVWQPEGFGCNVLVHSAWLLANASQLIVATGIANLYARDAMAMASARQELAEQSGGRFLLGIGVSHAPIVAEMRGHNYGTPVTVMRDYLTAMRSHEYDSVPPKEMPPTVIAALDPKMMALAAELSDGAHPYNATPEHTAEARKILAPANSCACALSR